MGRKKRLPLLEKVEILDVGAEGKAIAKKDGLVVFVEKVVPGDIADVQVIKKKKSFWLGRPVHFHQLSEKRIEPLCEHFGTCGGCKWQNISYADQLSFKQKIVGDSFQRIGKVELPEIAPILASGSTEYYRNKLEFTFSNKRWLTQEEIDKGDAFSERDAVGFHIAGMFDRIVDVQHCHLQRDPSNAIRLAIRDYAKKNNLSFFDLRDQNGFLRTLIIRTAETGEVMVTLAFFEEDKAAREGLLDFLKNKFPEITALLYVINGKGNDTLDGLEVQPYHGKDHMVEEMPSASPGLPPLQFKIGPKSFYQTNSKQAYELYKVALDFAQLTGKEVVYDLYTGTGTIAQFIASQAEKVVGVEYVAESIEDAKANAAMNNIGNTAFFAGDMKDVLNDAFVAANGHPDVIITDPPRAGMHADVIDTLLRIGANRIVYVSCNPSTQARDLALLDEKYRVTRIQPVDMFPHTHHVENVALLERRS